MKKVLTLIFIGIITGVVEHLHEVNAHKTLDIEDEGEGVNHAGEGGVDHMDRGEGINDFNSLTNENGASLDSEEGGVNDDKEFSLPPPNQQTLKEKIISFFKHPPIWYWTYYRMEMAFMVVFVLATVNLFIGKATNDVIAVNWRKNAIPPLVG